VRGPVHPNLHLLPKTHRKKLKITEPPQEKPPKILKKPLKKYTALNASRARQALPWAQTDESRLETESRSLQSGATIP